MKTIFCLLWALAVPCLFSAAHQRALSKTQKQETSSDNSPYLIADSILIHTTQGHTISAVVVRRKGIRTPQPAALLFLLYSNLERSRAEAKSAADHGYVGIVADVRGKRLSPDLLAPYENEATDVYEVIDWISRQHWSNGKVGMYGGSYSGFAQWAALKHRVHPALKTIVPYVAGIPGMGLPMENNIFINANYEWAFYVGNNKYLDQKANNDHQRWRQLAENWYASGKPYRKIDSLDGTPNPWLQRWLRHPAYDQYWQSMIPYQNEFSKIHIPILAIDGYYNDGQAAALHYLKEHLRYHPKASDYLIIGPYDHFGAQKGGNALLRGYQVDPVALINTRKITFQWFDYILKGAKKPALLKDKINYEIMGGNKWKHVPSLEKAHNATLKLYLSNRPYTGMNKPLPFYQLTASKPLRENFLQQQVDFADRSTENNYAFPDPIIQRALELPNGFAFVTEPYTKPISVDGSFSGELKVRLNHKDMDFSVVLYEVMPDGQYFELSYFLGRASYAKDPTTRKLLHPGQLSTIPFSNTKFVSRQLRKGSRLLVIINVNKNRFAQVNYGSGKEVSDESISDAKIPLNVKWYNQSYISIPISK